MRRQIVTAVLCCIFFLTPHGHMGQSAQQALRELIVCGWDEVFILDASDATRPVKTWRWKAKSRSDLPQRMRTRFNMTSECKPVDDGRRILITSSSGGGVALVERKTGRALFYGVAPNAHSADILPGNRIVVSCAIRANRLVVFDLAKTERPVCSSVLPDGHGVVWDGKRQLLWALSGADLRAYRLENWDSAKPSLVLADVYKLPSGGGHDLYPIPGKSDLTVSAARNCWYFDRDKRTFRPITEIPKPWSIKSICIGDTGETAYVQAEGRNWWAENIHILPDRTINLPGERIYKARWNGH